MITRNIAGAFVIFSLAACATQVPVAQKASGGNPPAPASEAAPSPQSASMPTTDAVVSTSALSAATNAAARAEAAANAAANSAVSAAASAKNAADDKKNKDNQGVAEGGAPNYQIVRYVGVDSSHWKSTPNAPNYADLYTRLELVGGPIAGVGSNAPLRDYTSENSGWLERLFSNKSDTVTTLVDVSISDPTLKVAIPLFSITHSSGLSLGNVWTTNFTSSNVESPLFRIGPNTGITVHLNSKVSRDLKSQGASMAIGAITSAVQIAAPTSSLLTTLSKSDTASKANAIDQAISGLVSRDISEDIELGRLADSWTNQAYLKLFGCTPFVRTVPKSPVGTPSPESSICAGNSDFDGGIDTQVGEWLLRLACPRLSVFDARDICNAAFSSGNSSVIDVSDLSAVQKARLSIEKSASDAQILSFNMSSQVSVESFVQSQGWYTTFIGKGTAQIAADYTNFCTSAMLGLETNGLNKFDSALTLRAIIRSLPQVAALKTNFSATLGTECAALLVDAQAPLK